jgi:hypothetical protein
LLDHPAQMEKLRRHRGLIPKAVPEILRFGLGGPGGLPRYALRTSSFAARRSARVR